MLTYAQLARRHVETAEIVERHFSQGVEAENHPDLQNKGVQAYGLRLDAIGSILLPKGDPEGQQWSATGNLLIPIQDLEGRFLGAQLKLEKPMKARSKYPCHARMHPFSPGNQTNILP